MGIPSIHNLYHNPLNDFTLIFIATNSAPNTEVSIVGCFFESHWINELLIKANTSSTRSWRIGQNCICHITIKFLPVAVLECALINGRHCRVKHHPGIVFPFQTTKNMQYHIQCPSLGIVIWDNISNTLVMMSTCPILPIHRIMPMSNAYHSVKLGLKSSLLSSSGSQSMAN